MNIPLLNRNFEMPVDGWFHLAPFGEFPNVLDDGKKKEKVVQKIDYSATDTMVNRFRQESAEPNFPGLRIDYDHFSYDPEKSSEAAGWITDLQNREDGLWAKVRWSDLGEAAVKGGRYRFLSPVWNPADCQPLGNGRLRPLRLESAGLTNDPNLKGLAPLSNRRDDAAANTNHALRSLGEGGTTKKETMNPKLLEALGLAADATEEAAIAAVTELRNRVPKADHDALQGRYDALLNSQVDADLETFKDVIADKEATKVMLLSNRDATVKFLRGVRKPAAPAPLHNRATAGTPAPVAQTKASTAQQQRAAVEEYRLKNRCTHEEAWQAVKMAQPELFKPEETSEEK
jgi:phage I-like protein